MLYHVQVDDNPVKSKIIFEKLAFIDFENGFVRNERERLATFYDTNS